MVKLIEIDKMSAKQKLTFFIIALIVVIVLFVTLSSIDFGKKGIDYDEINKYEFIVNSTEIKDRDIYWTLDKIIRDFMLSYQTEEVMDTSDMDNYEYEGYSLEDYYNALDADYKEYLGKKKYMQLSKEFISKFVTENDNGFVLKEGNIIRNIYKLNNYDGYLCELNPVDNSTSPVIGIILDSNEHIFNIFYID